MKKMIEIINFLVDLIIGRDVEILKLKKLSSSEIFFQLNPREKCYFSFIFTIFSYQTPLVRKMIWQMKFRENKWAAKILGKFLAEVFVKNSLFSNSSNNFTEKIILIPIPIHKKRYQQRGYNQCEWLAKEMIKNLPKKIREKIIYNPRVLKRVHYTEKQSWHNEKNRKKNIKGVFEINSKINLSNQTIILLDDVYTTGATLLEARQTLEKTGATKIYALVVAH